MIPDWVWWVVGLIVLREIAAVVFGWGGDGFTIGSDPEGGTFGKSLKWHKRKRVYTSIRPDRGDDPGTASGHVEKSRPVNDGKSKR